MIFFIDKSKATSAKAEWKGEARLCSLYTFSSINYGILGILCIIFIKSNSIQFFTLIIISLTSYISDYHYLGEPTYWRAIDTVIAAGFTSYYMIMSIILHTFVSIFALFICATAIYGFQKSINSKSFSERCFWHTYWHFVSQLALTIYLLGDHVTIYLLPMLKELPE